MLKTLVHLTPLVLTAGSVAMLVFINLSGATANSTFLGKFYFSSVTSSDEYRWTMYSVCTTLGNGSAYCSKAKAAYPYTPADLFGAASVPVEFVKLNKTFYYLLKLSYAFFLMALVFSVLALLPVLCSCALAGVITGLFASIPTGFAALFSLLATAFETGIHAKGVAIFKKAGYEAKLGIPMFICMWLTTASLLITYLWMIRMGVHGVHEIYSSLKGGGKHHKRSDSDNEK